ncbi:MAG: LacI family DNA-binding transcriptional regulator [Clostridiales bacterium]|nr:LacI family transcriptional regulator [Roseburia sp.]MDD7636872.1 LacI family DNA-binding transcriptional regulator [Clostridiales bacterium]
MAVTITDVANEAGVSKSTVSKVLNHWPTISPATVARVNAAIEKLHYTPNSRAVSFARQTTQNIVYLTDLAKDAAYQNPHMFDIMCGVYHELARTDYSLSLADISTTNIENVIKGHSSDGLIIHGSAINPQIASLIIDNNFPHIIIGHPGFDSRLCWVDTNHALAGNYAADHMISCGYTDVAFIGGCKTGYISTQREKGFVSGMLDYGYRIPQRRIIFTDSSRKQGYETTHILLTSGDIPHAIICENNTLALGVIKAIQELALRIPEDIAVLTFDVYPYSSIIDPKLTVVDINVYDMGVQAGSMMLRKLENPTLLIQSYTTLPVVIQGESTKPLS